MKMVAATEREAGSSDELELPQAIPGNYRHLAAAVVLEAIEELQTNRPRATYRSLPAYDFLLSDWGLYLAEAGAGVPATIMREKAKGWERDRWRAYQYGSDGAEMAGELQDQAEQVFEDELYFAWIVTKREQKRYRRMKKARELDGAKVGRRGRKRKFSAAQVKMMARLFNEGVSIKGIGQQMVPPCSHPVVTRVLRPVLGNLRAARKRVRMRLMLEKGQLDNRHSSC